MARCFSLVLLLTSIWTTRLLVQGSLRAEGSSFLALCSCSAIEMKPSNHFSVQLVCILLQLWLGWRWIRGHL
ncbi:LYVE1 isoform 2 [Pan troglodytes]|uniref:Lymphatic vessel endothelial hyaluronan receptor 1 n=2 Tax=Homininae TaxID=207598 RepID=E7EPC7_HUMAN|nr:lymphatic vessel endothelial hyaluronan receptor 1 [Homo sapiens]KAI4070085.1 lymphatic vessel endothelial hyaluronan receptor 1 [Homo sapiens]PNI79307.1 LYVE1 isoform 2 [Pan troglodytes]